MPVTFLPLDRIDPHALPRDRLAFDPEALDTLQASIAAEGLRQPVEVFPIDGPLPWGLVSGFRRLTCFQRLARTRPEEFATIPCIIRQPADLPQALALMVSENEIRAQITPWEKGALIRQTLQLGLFPGIDSAVDALYPALSRQARSRLRGFARVVEALDGALAAPVGLSSARMDRLAAALRAGLGEVMLETLRPLRRAGPEAQWRALLPAIAEAILAPDSPDTAHPRPGRPRRLLRLSSGITLRREWTPTGWLIRIDARHAEHPEIVDDILDVVERWFQEGR